MSDFEPVTLGDCVELRSGNTPSKARPDFWNGGFPWISAKDMKSYWISSSEDTLTNIGAAHANRVPAGTTLLLARGMTLHNDIPICRVAQESSFNQDVKAVLPKDGVCNEFVPYLLLGNKRKIQGIVDSAGHGTGRLNTDQLLGLSVFRPLSEDQKKIVEVASFLDEKIELNRKQNRTLEAIAQALFKRWFVEFEFPDENGRPYKASGGAMQPSELGEIPVGWEVKEGFRQLNQERNSIQHIAALNASESEERFEQLLPDVKMVLYELRKLRNVSFIQYRRSEPTPRDLKCRKFDGYTLGRMNYDLCLSVTQFAAIGANLTANRLYAELGEDIFCVSPFAHVVDENHQTYLCFYKKKNNATSFRFERVGTPVGEFDLDGSHFQDIRDAIEGALQHVV